MEPIVNVVSKPQTKTNKITIGGKLLIAATGGIGLGISVICASFVSPAFRKICLPYVPCTTAQLSHVLGFLPKNTKPFRLLDIGSGDGRIAIAAAKHSKTIMADGVELNPWLVLYSRLNALRNGISKRTTFFRKDLWNFNISDYNYIIIFGVEQMMKDLETKLISELSPGAKIIACRFPLPNLQPKKTVGDGINTVWFYELSAIERSRRKL